MHVMNLNRRGFVKRISGGLATMGVIPSLSAFQSPVYDLSRQAQVSINDLRITDLKSLRLQFPMLEKVNGETPGIDPDP
jgi:hypothetical protein